MSTPGVPNAIWRPLSAQHPVEAARLVDVVGRHQHSAPLGGQLVDQRREHLRTGDVDAGEGLVEQHEPGVLHERTGDQHTLALAARELAERARRELLEVDRRQRVACAARARDDPGAATRAGARASP